MVLVPGTARLPHHRVARRAPTCSQFALVGLAIAALAGGCLSETAVGDNPSPREPGHASRGDAASVDDDLPASLSSQCPGDTSTISGRVLAPNGSDPIAGAAVFITNDLEAFERRVTCERCQSSGDGSWRTTSGFDGSFELTGVCSGAHTVVLANGRFRRVLELDLDNGQDRELTADETRMPRRPAEFNPLDSVPRIAVATGDYDKMECVLRNIGLSDESVDLYEAATMLVSPGKALPPFSDLISDAEKMRQYNIIFINCTHDTFEPMLRRKEIRENLAGYLRAGGRLYVTDWSYDWIEQVEELAPFVDFEPGKSDTNPEPLDDAARGKEGLRVTADVVDPQLARWLDQFPGALDNGKLLVEHFLLDWVMIHDIDERAKVWVQGEVRSGDLRVYGERPLTVTFNFSNCGKLLFSSYHTEGREDEFVPQPYPEPPTPTPQRYPAYCGKTLSPQDRVLEYLIFDIASCVRPVQ